MNREEIIRMAKEVDIPISGLTASVMLLTEIDRLVNAAYAAGAAAERKTILQMSMDNWYKTQADYDAAIRARGNQ